MKKTSNFVKDLEEGKEAELRVQQYLNTKYGPEHHYLQAVGKNSKCDLWCLSCSNKVEVKRDRMAPKTGNLCIERNLFAKTHSQVIAYVIEDTAYIFEHSKLWQEVVKLAKAGKTDARMLGDRDANSAILVKLEDILPIAEAVELKEGVNAI